MAGFELTFQNCIVKKYVKKKYLFSCHVKGHNGLDWATKYFEISACSRFKKKKKFPNVNYDYYNHN